MGGDSLVLTYLFFFMLHLCSQIQSSVLNVFSRVGEVEYMHTGLESIGVGWVESMLAAGNGKNGQWLSSWEWVSSLPTWSRTAAARCVYGCHAKKPQPFSWDNATLELRTSPLSGAEAEYAVPVCQNTGLVSFPEILAGQGGQALNLSCEISCVVTNEFKLLYQNWGLENNCLSVVNFCWIIFSLYLNVLYCCNDAWTCRDLLCMGSTFKSCTKVEGPWQNETNPKPCIFVQEVTHGSSSVELWQGKAEWRHLLLALEAPGWWSCNICFTST